MDRQVRFSLDMLVTAFESTLSVQGRPFGTTTSKSEGVSDDNSGVQWNVGVEKESGVAWVGVNLEGMKYDGWPIARFIERELKEPQLPDLVPSIEGASAIQLRFFRDAWLIQGRPPIEEKHISASPIQLSQLSHQVWLAMLEEAYDCLDAERNHRGRARQVVTLTNAGRREMEVSPHLHLLTPIWNELPGSQEAASENIESGFLQLRRVYELIRRRAAKQATE